MPKRDLNKVAKHGRSPVNLLHIIRTLFPKNTSGWLFLSISPESVRKPCQISENNFHCSNLTNGKNILNLSTMKGKKCF